MPELDASSPNRRFVLRNLHLAAGVPESAQWIRIWFGNRGQVSVQLLSPDFDGIDVLLSRRAAVASFARSGGVLFGAVAEIPGENRNGGAIRSGGHLTSAEHTVGPRLNP